MHLSQQVHTIYSLYFRDHIKSKHPEVLMDGGVKLPNTHFESMEQKFVYLTLMF